MAENHRDVTQGDLYGLLARILKDLQVPEPLRKEAAVFLIVSGWSSMLGVTEDALRLVDPAQRPASQVNDLYDEGAELLLDDRV